MDVFDHGCIGLYWSFSDKRNFIFVLFGDCIWWCCVVLFHCFSFTNCIESKVSSLSLMFDMIYCLMLHIYTVDIR